MSSAWAFATESDREGEEGRADERAAEHRGHGRFLRDDGCGTHGEVDPTGGVEPQAAEAGVGGARLAVAAPRWRVLAVVS